MLKFYDELKLKYNFSIDTPTYCKVLCTVLIHFKVLYIDMGNS